MVNKRLKSQEQNTEIYGTTTYSRDTGKGPAVTRIFSLVIGGLLLSSSLLGGLLGGPIAYANQVSPSPAIAASATTITESDDAYLLNLSRAVQVLNEQGWSLQRLEVIANSLTAIEQRLSGSTEYNYMDKLRTVILDTEKAIVIHGGDGLSTLRGEENTINGQIQRIKQKIGLTTTVSTVKLAAVNQNTAQSEITTAKAAIASNEIIVMLDGVKQSYSVAPVMSGGTVLVPMRGIFEAMGCKINFDAVGQVITAKKGDTFITLALGDSYGYVNFAKIRLAVKAQTIKNTTMVPLRFVAEALGANVSYDKSSNTVTIDSQKDVQKVIGGIAVKYGDHTYGSQNSDEYNKVMAIAQAAVSKFEQYEMPKEYAEYIDGVRWSGDKADRSERNVQLYFAEADIGELVKAGVSKEKIEHVYKTMLLAWDLAEGKSNPGDGSPKSAYDNLVRGVSDCDSDAQVLSLVFDFMGYNTIILAGNSHADMYVQVGDIWCKTVAGTFTKTGLQDVRPSDARVVAQPTFGEKIVLNKQK